MSKTLRDLLAADQLAQRTGAGLNPRLKEAIEASLRFDSVSAGPIPIIAPEDLPEDVVAFPAANNALKKQA